jgi:hypothetical protein
MTTPTITVQIRALQSLSPAQLVDRYAEIFGKPPRVRNAAWLRRQIAWRIQERAFGGLSDRARTRLDELTAQIDMPLAHAASPPRPRPTPARASMKMPTVGTTLIRRWHDQEIRVEVCEGGYAWNGALYKSLSAVAKAITGANWNGKLFFGLVSRRTGA